MTPLARKRVLTTGEVARICHVAPRTVSKWFDTGKLRGYRIPGSRDRRIPLDQLVAFMRAHDMPLDGLDQGLCRVLVVDDHAPQDVLDAIAGHSAYELRTAPNDFTAGIEAERFRPHVIVFDAGEDPEAAGEICRGIRSHAELEGSGLVAVCDRRSSAVRRLLQCGFDVALERPYSIDDLITAIQDATDLVH
jgi:excisionase family DNA binding protein